MPDPALPFDPDADNGPLPNYTREFTDLQGRPMTGRVTLTSVGPPPVKSMETTIESGRVSANLPAGLYNMKAMLRDPDGVRAFICEDINVRITDA